MTDEDSIVITGLGLVSPFGTDKGDLWSCLESGYDGRVLLDGYGDDYFTLKQAHGIPIRDWRAEELLGKRGLQFLQPSTRYLMGAAILALRDAGLEGEMPRPEELGVVVGTNFAGAYINAVYDYTTLTEGPKYVSPMEAPNTLANAPASHLAIRIRAQACNTTISTGTCAGLDALGYAMNVLKQNRASHVVVGGVEELNSRVLWIYENGGLLPTGNWEDSGRPFDAASSGFLPSEGSAVAVLERRSSALARGAHIYGELLAWSSAFSATSIMERRVNAMVRTWDRSLAKTSLQTKEVGLIVSGANGLREQDHVEACALARRFGDQGIPIVAVKGVLGEAYGAGGMYQLLAAIGAAEHRSVPGAARYRNQPAQTPELPTTRSEIYALESEDGLPILLTSQDVFGATSALLIKSASLVGRN
jgi:3-oxoacyl-[acyl-carrier-protein] synthase II